MIYFFSCSRSMANKSFLSSASSSYFCFWRSSSIFLISSSFSFSFAFSLYFSDSISIADFLLDLATFLLVPVEINYQRKKKSVVFIYIEEQPKHQALIFPQVWVRRYKITLAWRVYNNQCGRKMSLSNNIKIMDLLSPLDEQSSSWGKLSKMFT